MKKRILKFILRTLAHIIMLPFYVGAIFFIIFGLIPVAAIIWAWNFLEEPDGGAVYDERF